MKTSLIFAAFTAMLTSMPVAAQTIYNSSLERVAISAPLTLAERIEVAAEDACGRPFIRDLKGRKLHEECMAEVRAEIEAQLAENDEAVIELAQR